jgi:hypothetical protein
MEKNNIKSVKLTRIVLCALLCSVLVLSAFLFYGCGGDDGIDPYKNDFASFDEMLAEGDGRPILVYLAKPQ